MPTETAIEPPPVASRPVLSHAGVTIAAPAARPLANPVGVLPRRTKVTPELAAEVRRRLLACVPMRKHQLVVQFRIGKNTVERAILQEQARLEAEQEAAAGLPGVLVS
jgi:hypothetical protein